MPVNPVPEYCRYLLEPLVGSRMLELGNKKTGDVSYKSYFESLGFEHVSVDWNGEDGALPLDLRDPLPDWPPFDMVTNFGTTEHVVDNQSAVWANIHRMVKVGGVYIGMCPSPEDWWWHGEWYVPPEWYREFAGINGYEIEHLAIGREYPNRNVDVRLRKIKDATFEMPKTPLFYNEMRPR